MAKLKHSALKQLLKFYKAHIKLYFGFFIILVIKAVISFFSALFISKIISYMMEANYEKAFQYAVINLLVLLFYSILSIINTYFYKNLENRVRFDLQQKIIESALNIKMQYYDNLSSGVIVTRLTSDIDYISERFKSLTEKMVNIMRRISYLAYIFVLDIRIGFLVLISVMFVSFVYTIRIHYLSKLKPKVKAKREIVNSKIIETIRAIKDIKTLNCDENVLSLIGKEQKEYIKRDNHEYYVGIALSKLTDIVTHISDFIFILMNIYLIGKGDITTAIFYTCYLYKDHTFSLANEIGDFRYKLAECEVCAKRLIALVYPKTYDIDSYGIKNIKNYEGDIKFQNVSFSYIDEIPVLKQVSFEIKPKSTVAFVGESGSGKSTITSLIGHLYYKSSGSILFGNYEIDELNKQFIRDNITIVNQFPYLFNLSIRDNFKMIKSDITDETIWNVCEKVQLKEFIESLPLGLDSIIGEGGCQLSGGQKQKLCIARSLCRNVKVMIFDEATSSLDNVSQNEIMEIIQNLSKDVTVIMIAHRLSTVAYADSIILVRDGEIVGSGKHEELLKTNTYYKSLYLKSIQNN